MLLFQFILILFMLPAAAFADEPDMVLPTIDDPRIQHEADAIENDPRSTLNAENRKTRLFSELKGLGQEYQNKNEFDKALKSYNAALRLDRNAFSQTPRRGYLFAIMDKWPEAVKDFDATEWNLPYVAQAIIEFCITNARPDIARRYEKTLRLKYTDSSMTQTLSRLCMQTGRPAEGRRLAQRAYYLDWVSGSDVTESKSHFTKVTGSVCVSFPEQDKTAEKQFWSTLDKVITKGQYFLPGEIRKLLSEPTSVNGSESRGGATVNFEFTSDSPDATIRSASLICGDNATPHGLQLEPNVLCCCLRQDDVLNYMKTRSLKIEKVYQPIDSVPPEQDHVQLVAKTEWGKITFDFSPKGFGALNRVQVYCNTGGTALLPPLVIPGLTNAPSWQDHFADAQTCLKKKKFVPCRDKLCNAFTSWDIRPDHGRVKIPAEKRSEYESLKQLFVALYQAWSKPEIAEFFQQASRGQINAECYAVAIDETHEEFPTVTEFRHSMWKISTREVEEKYITLEIPGCLKRTVSFGSPLYEALHKQLDGKLSATIFPVSGELVDNEDFLSDPTVDVNRSTIENPQKRANREL